MLVPFVLSQIWPTPNIPLRVQLSGFALTPSKDNVPGSVALFTSLGMIRLSRADQMLMNGEVCMHAWLAECSPHGMPGRL